MNYQIIALKNAEQSSPGPEMLYLNRWGEWIQTYTYVWLIQGGGKRIIVDTGVRDVDELNPGIVTLLGEKAKFKMGEGEDTVSILRGVGVNLSDVQWVILSHLHYDHISNLKLFPKARIALSRKGWLNVLAPKYRSLVPPIVFPRDIFAYLVDEAWDRVHLLPEEEEILPGIKVFWIGGHTACSQAVSVKTNRGKVVLTGDTVFLYENIEKDIPVGLNYNLVECLDAMEKIRREADIIIPSHDPKVLEKYRGGRIE